MLNAAMQGSPWCWLGFLPDKQIVCLPRILCARQAAASSKKSSDQICSGEVSLASSRRSIHYLLCSLRPTITTSPELSTSTIDIYHPISTAVTPQTSQHVCGGIQRGSWGWNPLCGAIWRALPHGSPLLGIHFPRIDPCPCWRTATNRPLHQDARTVSTRTKRAVFVTGVASSQSAASVLKAFRKN